MIKINKIQARREFILGRRIRVTPCKIRPDNTWSWYADIQAEDMERYYMVNGEYKKLDRGWLFDNWIIRWYYYNGGYEQGYYPAFYLVD